MHFFATQLYMKATWAKYITFVKLSNNHSDFGEMARRVRDKGSIEDLEKFFLISWGLWYRRN